MSPAAGFLDSTPRHVFTPSPLPSAWWGAEAVHERAEDHVARLKTQSGGDIGVHGSITFAQSLLATELVDELRLVVVPTVAHSGRRLLQDGPVHRRLDRLSARPSATGTLFAHYATRCG